MGYSHVLYVDGEVHSKLKKQLKPHVSINDIVRKYLKLSPVKKKKVTVFEKNHKKYKPKK